MKRYLLAAIFGAVFGALSAYVSAEVFNSIHVDSEKPHNHWYDCAMISLTPGGVIDRLIYGDQAGFNLPYEDSIEGEGLKDAILFNALGWAIVASTLLFVVWLARLSCSWIVAALPGASHAR